MTDPARGFKRMVVGLPQSMINQAGVDAAADLAELLKIELLAAFVADASLHALAGFPGARELRTLEREWQTIDLAQLSRDIEGAASAARQRFADTVRRRAIRSNFDIVAGAEVMASLIRADDIVAIIEPPHPAERITRQFAALLDAALATAGAVLILPQRLARTAGPIMAIASDRSDASVDIALDIAAALKETLVTVTRRGAPLSAEFLARAQAAGIHVEQVSAESPLPGFGAAPLALPKNNERLRVVARSQIPDDPALLFATLQGVPLLVVEPDRIEFARLPPADQPRGSH